MAAPAHNDMQTLHRSLSRLLQEKDDDNAVGPIRAGMRARAIADACEVLGLPAVLIDGTGQALHVGVSAAAMLGGDFEIAAGHLVGTSPPINQAVQRAVTAVVNGRIGSADRNGSDTVTIVGLPYRDPSPFQLLRGVLVILTGSDARPRLAALGTMLAV